MSEYVGTTASSQTLIDTLTSAVGLSLTPDKVGNTPWG